MTNGFFITGTDTGVGKTTVALGLLRWLRNRGYRTAAMKPVAAGAGLIDGQWRNDDALQLQSEATVKLPYEMINPFALPEPVAPHLAAQAHGITIDMDRITTAFAEISARADAVIVEGIGGWKVPLNAAETGADLAWNLGLPVIVVAGIRLGCLNHALLTCDAVRAAGLPLAGWIANVIDPDCLCPEENIRALKVRLDAPLLGALSHLEEIDPDAIASCLDLTAPRTAPQTPAVPDRRRQ